MKGQTFFFQNTNILYLLMLSCLIILSCDDFAPPVEEINDAKYTETNEPQPSDTFSNPQETTSPTCELPNPFVDHCCLDNCMMTRCYLVRVYDECVLNCDGFNLPMPPFPNPFWRFEEPNRFYWQGNLPDVPGEVFCEW